MLHKRMEEGAFLKFSFSQKSFKRRRVWEEGEEKTWEELKGEQEMGKVMCYILI